MHILILGASSLVGTALAQAFAPKNALTLVGRNAANLADAAQKCGASGAALVDCVSQDFSLNVDCVLQAIEGIRIDLLIDAASATSGKRDSEIQSNEMADLVSADFSSRTKIIDHILRNQTDAPAVILISTILTLVKSPGRSVYTALKVLYETYLKKIRDKRPEFNLLVVYVGTVIDAKNESDKPKKLASAVFDAFARNRRRLFYGVSGMLFLGLFYFQPIAFYLVTLAQRKIRQRSG